MSTRIRNTVSRRTFLRTTAVLTAMSTAGAAALRAAPAQAKGVEDLTAAPPDGFVPLHAPGKVVKVTKGKDFAALMQPNQLWPKAEAARQMLERAMTELTGAPNLTEAMKRFVHPKDVVAIKVNGIGGQKGATMAVNYELILPVVEAVLGVGVPPANVSVFEQYPSYLYGTRVGTRGHELPKGVNVGFHGNRDATMRAVRVYDRIETKYVRYATDATAILDLTQIKDHSICGYTGTMKNMTHGQITNPHEHHTYGCNPQIAMLYNHPVLQSRVRLHITDAFKIIYDGGPLDKYPERRIPHGAVYVSTDAVAMDTVGWRVIEQARKENGLPTLARARREPAYIGTAAELGLGIHDDNRIVFRQVSL
jgi:uncharacterized protein (DUF362 family)